MQENLTERQKKINTLLQQEIALLLQKAIRQEGRINLMVSISKVRVSVDLTTAKVFVSFFPPQKAASLLQSLKDNSVQLKHDLSQILRHQLRRIPELNFYIDDSLDYIEKIDSALNDGQNPLKNPETLSKRQKK
jgi:ribosome-binding factor A